MSTPPNRTRKRRPLTHSPALNASYNSSLLENNDDFEERRQRRKSKLLTNNILSPGGVQPSPSRSVQSEKDKRRSVNLSHAGMTNVQLKEHYANCIKLSSENKINVKNAFGLHLIDYMKDLLKQSQKDESVTNFQVASCTLDAGVKIYAYRVDSVHNEAYKVLGSLGRVVDNNEGDEEGETVQTQEGNTQEPTKKKKKKLQGKTIETNLKNINQDTLDLDFEIDPFFTKIASRCDEAGTTSILSFHLQSYSEMNDLVLDPLTKVNEVPTTTVGETSEDEHMIDLTELREMYQKLDVNNIEICPQFSSFKFMGWDKNSKDIAGDGVNLPDDSFDGDNIHRFDENAPVISDAGESFDVGGGADDDDGFEEDGVLGDVKFDGQAATMSDGIVAKGSLINTSGSTHLTLSLEPSEYSYFSQEILSMWAGPLHWKVKARSKEKNSTVDGSTKMTTTTKKTHFRIDFDEEIDLKKNFTTGRASTHLKESTLEKYASQMSVLPPDLNYENENLFKLGLRKFMLVKRQADATELKNEDDEWYNYNNKNDREGFCPVVDDGYGANNYDDDDDGYDDVGGTPVDISMTQSPHDVYEGDTLVAPPDKVRVIDINYAKSAKRIDIKRLKGTMWKLLTAKKSDDKENMISNLPKPDVPTEEEKPDEISGNFTFKSMYEVLPNNVSTNMAKNLSTPIAFVCLLYLANEKGLFLKSKDDMSDIEIESEIVNNRSNNSKPY